MNIIEVTQEMISGVFVPEVSPPYELFDVVVSCRYDPRLVYGSVQLSTVCQTNATFCSVCALSMAAFRPSTLPKIETSAAIFYSSKIRSNLQKKLTIVCNTSISQIAIISLVILHHVRS